ncbi:hypothetical protein [Paraburkholderia phosphatilytica]|uniref:hypothetical protein n=1 Tax=Paraburkholderia phosphatilytica TaxID=2282883 RepID=UPI000E543F1B|nr:hypothetical protein [Paraburkholderia phosphatilytica]
MKTIRKVLEQTYKTLRPSKILFDSVQQALRRLTELEEARKAERHVIAELRSFVDYCEKLPGAGRESKFTERVKRARAALDTITDEHEE